MNIAELFSGFGAIREALFTDLSLWWVLAPIVVLWVSMEVYFGEYKREQLGFSSALANGISLSWIAFSALRLFFSEGFSIGAPEFYALAFFAIYGVFVVVIAFRHAFSPRVVNYLAAPSLIYLFSTLAVLWGQNLLEISIPVLAALLIILAIIWGFFALLKRQLGILGEIEAVRRAGDNDKEV